MSIYNIDGTMLDACYDINKNVLQKVYDISENIIFTMGVDSPYIDGRILLFEDDFESFNENMWMCEIGNVRNYNTELQCYRAENVSIENSMLVLTAKRESYGGKEWTSGSISGQTLQNFKYGRVEAKIKFPNITGSFGAFWMLGSNFWKEYVDGEQPINNGVLWAKCGEIDIAETIPGKATYTQANIWTYGGQSYAYKRSPSINIDEWHVYGIEWTEDDIDFMVDDEVYLTISGISTNDDLQAYRLPMYMILNHAVGSSGGTPSDDVEEMKMYVDWVRIHAPLY